MSRISVDVSSARIPVLQVGYQGENEVTDVLFDISSWITEFGEGVAQLRVKRPGNSEEESYVLSLTITDGIAVWTVSETDTFNKGNGKVQLSYLVGNIVKKAVIYPYKVGKSIVGADNPVDPFDSWIERSKAWAIGETLDGNAVPETDETYQNNAKYYAEQADILGSAQVVLATEQVTLATEKATLATEKADAAAASETNAAASEAAVNGVSTQLTTRMSAIETEQSVQSARMDTFTSLPEGSTSGNAELADIRVGADGTTYDTAGNAVRGQIGELNSYLGTLSESYLGILSGKITLDSIAWGGKTYRDIFISGNAYHDCGNFENGLDNIIEKFGEPIVTTDESVSKEHSLKCFGTSSTYIKYPIRNTIFVNGNNVYTAVKVKCVRHELGIAGVQLPYYNKEHIDNPKEIYIENTTNDFVTVSDLTTNITIGAASGVFIGTLHSANIDAYLDDFVAINLGSAFGENYPTKKELDYLYEIYTKIISIKNYEESSSDYREKVMVGAILDATTLDNRFIAMKELYDIAVKKLIDGEYQPSDNDFTSALKGAVCILPSCPPAMLENYDFELLYSKDVDVQASIASTSKVMSLITGLDYICSVKEIITIISDDIQSGSGNVFSVGDTISIEDLMLAMMLPSSNTAGMAFARICGEKMIKLSNPNASPSATECVNAFVSQMNIKATRIGMNNSNFVSPTGYTSENKSTVNDLVKMVVEACSYNQILKVWNKKSHTINVGGSNPRAITIDTTVANDTLERDYYILGGKTGSLNSGATASALVMIAKLK